MRRSLAILALAVALPSPLRTSAGDFDAVVGAAERLDSLEPFLVRFVGRCTDRYEKRTCEANVAAARRAALGKTFAVRIPDAAGLVRPELDGSRFVLLLTPFIDGGGLALTHGAPTRQDRAGHPLIGLIPIKGSLPDGMMEMDFESPFRTGAIELEIVFRPERTWKLGRKAEAGSYEGLAARFLAIRVIDARTGNPIAVKVM